ncbi:MAG: sugar phosphate isomerase/epimerase [Planctomycetota bacterium]|jgi:sugar phosphate isomerase/epimerase|nr:sugar phosphate isomerase/epimerase [Planctomycetota bacterium]
MGKRPVTLFTGQWADLTFDTVCQKAAAFGYDGLELATWGDHMEVGKAASDPAYVKAHLATLKKYKLKSWAIGSHLIGQCVTSRYDPRYDGFMPAALKGRGVDAMQKWASEEMLVVAKAAKAMGIKVVTGFTGSPIWNYWYSFPQTSQQQVDDAFKEVVDKWTPILDAFDQNGVKFALEVHPTEIAFDFYSTEKLLKAFGYRETFGLNFDPSHLLWQGVNPALFVREFGSRIYHVHVKDAQVTLDGRAGILGGHIEFGDTRRGWNFCSPGHGGVNFDAIVRELNAINYDGPLSVEWEDSGMDREFGASEACEFVRKFDYPASNVAFDDALRKD